jgi:hypothetical protein
MSSFDWVRLNEWLPASEAVGPSETFSAPGVCLSIRVSYDGNQNTQVQYTIHPNMLKVLLKSGTGEIRERKPYLIDIFPTSNSLLSSTCLIGRFKCVHVNLEPT